MTTKDIDMKDASKSDDSTKAPESVQKTTPEEAGSLLLADLKKNISLLEKTVASKETRLTARVLRTLPSTRRKLTADLLRQIINQTFVSESDTQKQVLLGYLDKVPATTTETKETVPMDIAKDTAKKPKPVIPEVEVYLSLLVIIFLIDKKLYQEAAAAGGALVERLASFNRRTLNPLSAKVYFYYSRSYELMGKLDEIRGTLLAHHRTATLRHNDEAQATLLNLLLRNYLAYNLYDQADKLVSKTTFREDTVSSNEHARYLYYVGKIKSVQLEYTEAYRFLAGAMRKAPQNAARGFRIAVNKLACIVQLLMGEIPERSVFRQPGLRKALSPYFQLTQAVRFGDLAVFTGVVHTHKELFRADKTYTLIQRLHHNVIKTGLRKINLSYSRISLADVCAKLHLDSVEDVEFIVAKAIRDGVITATIDHEGRFIQSKENIDVYSTQEPQSAYHRRIEFCLNIHNEAVKAMRFPPDAHKATPVESAKERREREQEIAKNLAEEEEDDF